MKKRLYLKENTFEKTSVPKRKKVQNLLYCKEILVWKRLPYLKENVFEKKDFCTKKKKSSKWRKHNFWKRLLYLKEKRLKKTAVPKRKNCWKGLGNTFKKEKSSKLSKNTLNIIAVPWKRLLYLKENTLE